MKSKTIYLLIFLILILVVILFIKSKTQPQVQNNQPEQASETKTPQQTETFTLISTNIEDKAVGITEPIKLTFSQPVSSNFIYILEPQSLVQISLGKNPNELIIDVVDAWGFDINYTLKISQFTTSTINQTLDKDYTFTFKTPPYSGI